MTDETLIVGAGIIGLLTARTLLQQGQKVRLVDAGASRPCASWAAGGILSPLFPWRNEAAVSRLTGDAVGRYQRLADALLAEGCIDPEVDACGLLALAAEEQPAAVAWSHAQQVAMSCVTAASVQPGMSATPALWFSHLGAVRNSRLLTSLRQSLAKQGVIAEATSVLRLQKRAEGWRAHTTNGTLDARKIVVAAGAWSAELLRPLGVALPVMPVKGQMALYQLADSLAITKLGCVVVSDKGYLVPRRDGLVLLGSTLETPTNDMLPDASGAQQLAQKWAALVQQLGAQLQGATQLAQWAGWRPGNISDVPFIGELAQQPGLFVCSGHYRNGICAAPASVELLCAQLLGQSLPFDAAPYALPSSSSSSPSSVSA